MDQFGQIRDFWANPGLFWQIVHNGGTDGGNYLLTAGLFLAIEKVQNPLSANDSDPTTTDDYVLSTQLLQISDGEPARCTTIHSGGKNNS